jgi:proteasome lid subunit RPN8/RPN11
MKIKKNALDQIVILARQAAPCECCGFMMAETLDPAAVTWVLPAQNIEKEIPEQKFAPDHGQYLKAVELEALGKAKVTGVYHSHPGGRPIPSAYDTEMAVPGLIYLIVATNGDTVEQRAWKLDDAKFQEEPLHIE